MIEAIGIGKTLDDATENALKQLNAERIEVEVDPLSAGSKGFLGIGSKPAEVRAVVRDDPKIRATVFMRNVLKLMSINTELSVREAKDELLVSLGEEASPLIGHHGQTLDALQYLITRYLNGDKEEWRKVNLDIDNYRDKRDENLKSMALKYAERVASTKRDIKTQPLSAPERRIIHMTLKENPSVTTFSIGGGDKKRVVIASNERPSGSERRERKDRGGSERGGGERGGNERGGGDRRKSGGGNRGRGGRGRRGGGQRRERSNTESQ